MIRAFNLLLSQRVKINLADTMISNADVKAATEAAKLALREIPDLSWIARSSLVRRAYFSGLMFGLEAIAENADATNSLFNHIATNTMQARPGDDSFRSTKIGAAFESLKTSVEKEPAAIDKDRLMETIKEIRTLIGDNADGYKSCCRATHQVLSEILSTIDNLNPRGLMIDQKEQSSNLRKIISSISDLEGCLRFLALLETFHLLTERFGE